MDTQKHSDWHLLPTIRPHASPSICISLIMLAAVFRLLLSFKSFLENHQADSESNQQYTLHVRRGERTRSAFTGATQDTVVVSRNFKRAREWQMAVDGPRAAIDAVIIGVLYLLMGPLMTMNAGYYLSILFGIVLGNLAVRRYCNENLTKRTIGFIVIVVAVIISSDWYLQRRTRYYLLLLVGFAGSTFKFSDGWFAINCLAISTP